MDDLSFNTFPHGHRTVVQVHGEIDIATAPQLNEQFATLIQYGQHHLVVDLEDVAFIDSTGLAVLIDALNRVRNHEGSLCVVCTQEQILKLFAITGLTDAFAVHSSIAEAAAATGYLPASAAASAPSASTPASLSGRAYGNQRSAWDHASKPDEGTPEHR